MTYTYTVTQTLVRQRVVRVEARSAAEAKELAKDGHGEITTQERRYWLLCSMAERMDTYTNAEEAP